LKDVADIMWKAGMNLPVGEKLHLPKRTLSARDLDFVCVRLEGRLFCMNKRLHCEQQQRATLNMSNHEPRLQAMAKS
jgi:hypothetical protein